MISYRFILCKQNEREHMALSYGIKGLILGLVLGLAVGLVESLVVDF